MARRWLRCQTLVHLASLFCVASCEVAFAQDVGGIWQRLQRQDADSDGRISRSEFRGPETMFNRADANGDGFVTREEADALRQRNERPQAGEETTQRSNPMLLNRLDADRDDAISLEEWTSFFKKADNDHDGILQADEWWIAMRSERGPDNAPAAGSPAPHAKAKTLSNGRQIDLSKPKRTTVLVFGSYT